MNFYGALSRKMKIFHWILASLIIATLLFIWIQSMLPVSVSVEHSTSVGKAVISVFPSDSPLADFIMENIRKIAHFTEFGLLGLEVSLYVILFIRRFRKSVPLSLAFGFFVAFIDESIQMLSDRGSAIRDMWLDILGFLSLTVITYAIAYLTHKLRKRKKQ